MLREFTCIMCPQGCDIEAEADGDKIISVKGNKCPKGKEYVTQELINPMRNIATSVLVIGGELPLASVRLNHMIPKSRIYDIMGEIKKISLKAPVNAGDVVIKDVLGLSADVIVTKNVAAK